MTNPQAYIMDHPKEAQRLLDKVDAEAWISKYLQPNLPHVKSLLSVGCGPGVFLREVAEKNPQIEVAGVDLSESRIRDAEQRRQHEDGSFGVRIQILKMRMARLRHRLSMKAAKRGNGETFSNSEARHVGI